MRKPKTLEAVTHNTFYKKVKESNTICSEAVLGYFQKINKYKIKIEML